MSTLVQPGFEESDAEFSFATGANCEYRVERIADKVWHHEIRRDLNRDVIYDQAVEVQYSIGSGARGKGYLIERDDLLFMSPISWYAGKRTWGLSPGYSPENHQRFERRVTDGCLTCHAGLVSFHREEPDRYPSPKFRELSIGCERCHGPGEQHIAFQRTQNGSHASANVAVDTIVNPAKLPRGQREAVCNQCHLQLEHRPLRYGRTHFDFRPGMELEAVFTAFQADDHAPVSAGVSRAVSQVTQMRDSRCYSASKSQLGCISCHDSHGVPVPTEKAGYYRQRCLACHSNDDCVESPQQRQAEQNSCIACHMPKLSAEDVPHTSQTDHRIPRRRQAPQSSDPSDQQPQVTTLIPFDAWDQRLSRLHVVRAFGLLYAAQAQHKSAIQAEKALQAVEQLKEVAARQPDDLEALGALAGVYMVLNRRSEARPILEQILQQDPANEFALLQLALLLHADQQWEQSLKYWPRAIARNPWIPLTHVQHGQTAVKAGRIEEAIAAARMALEQNPGYLPAHIWLSENLPRVGQAAAGQYHRNMVERLRPMPE